MSLVATNKDAHCNDNNNNKADNDSHKANFSSSFQGSKICKVMFLKEANTIYHVYL